MIPASITLWDNLVTTQGKPLNLDSWETLFRHFSVHNPFAGDREHPGWSPAVFSPCQRGLDNVREMSALVLDYDGTENIDTAAELWGRFYGFIHTTRKHSREIHRFRVILPFGRRVAPDEYQAIWRRIFAMAGGRLDPAPKDPSRFWFTPGCPDPSLFEVRHLRGDILDPNEILDMPDPNEARPMMPARNPADPDRAYKRASAYVAQMPPAISGQGGHQALWAATLAAVQGFGLNESNAFALLWSEYNPRCQPRWSEKEIRHKVRDAANRSRLPTGYKLDEGRDWAPPQRAHYSAVTPLPATTADHAEEHDAAEPDFAQYERAAAAPVYTGEREADVPEYEADPSMPAIELPAPVAAVKRYSLRTMAEILNGVYRRASSGKPQRGISCGNKDIDDLIGGFRRGHVTVLGATTNWGKSSFAVQTTDIGLKDKKRILLVSGEDTEDVYGNRFMARRANVNAIALRDCTVGPSDLSAMAGVLGEAEQEPFFLNGIGKTVEYLAAAVTAICAEEDVDLVIVDYLQAFKCAKRCQDRRTEITHIAREFTDAIKTAGASGLIFSQLKRLEENHRPTMHDLKESGDVENMAEHVLIGYSIRPKGSMRGCPPRGQHQDEDRERRYVVVEKNKDGPKVPDPIEMAFDDATASFRDTRPRQWRDEQADHYYN